MKFKRMITPILALILAVLTEALLLILLCTSPVEDGPLIPIIAVRGLISGFIQIPGAIVAHTIGANYQVSRVIAIVVNIFVWWILYLILIRLIQKVKKKSPKWMPKVLKVLFLLVANILAAVLCAAIFLIMLVKSYPATAPTYDDRTYSEITEWIISDKEIIQFPIFFGTLSGLLSLILFIIMLRGRRYLTSGLFIYSVVLAEIIILTPFLHFYAWPLSYVALGLAFTYCRISEKRFFNAVSQPPRETKPLT